MNRDDRRSLHVYIDPRAHQAYTARAETLGVTVTALIQIAIDEPSILHAPPSDLGLILDRARAIDRNRRRRKR